MIRRFLVAGAAMAMLLEPTFAGAQAPLELQSMEVDLPFDTETFPDGPGSDAINNNCLACHSAAMVLNQPNMPKAAWAAIVAKMIKTYKAPVASEDVGAIVDYLAALKGRK